MVERKLVASDLDTSDFFGQAVAISGETVVVAADNDETSGGTAAGTAYVFERNAGGSNHWGQVARLFASDASFGDKFGFSVAISGDTIFVGDVGNGDAPANAGAVYVFERDFGGANNWGEIKKLTASDPDVNGEFGFSVSASGDTVVVGERHDDAAGNDAGAAYVFYRDSGGANNWGEIKKLIASDLGSGDDFGWSVGAEGDTVAVSAPDADNGTGAVYLFDRNSGGADNWGELKKVTASGAERGDAFGWSLEIRGDMLAVGAVFDSTQVRNSGSVYLFDRRLGGKDNWGEVRMLTASDAAVGVAFGWSVGIHGDTVVVGAAYDFGAASTSGSVSVFDRNTGGPDNWGEVRSLTAADTGSFDRFGQSVRVEGSTLVVGALTHDDGASNTGGAYVFSGAEVFPSVAIPTMNAWGLLSLVVVLVAAGTRLLPLRDTDRHRRDGSN